MENWKIFFVRENVLLEGMTEFQARTVALKWTASAIEPRPDYVPEWIVEKSTFTLTWREKKTAVCQRDASRFHLQGDCRCNESITLDD
jgi:hypothetical protein